MSQNGNNGQQRQMPSYRLVITDKENRKRKTNAGVLFEGPYGFNLLLNPGVQMRYEDQELYFFNLYPISHDQQQRASKDDEFDDPMGFVPEDIIT